MRISRFFSERKNIRINSSVKLPDSDITHIRKVLRLEKGEQIIIFNGEKEFLAELKIVSNEVVMALVKKVLSNKIENSSKVKVTLFQALLRAGKFDEIIQRTTELGIDNIVPTECEFSQSRTTDVEKKIDRWNKVAVAASKQSERVSVPQIEKPIKFNEIQERIKDFDLFLFLTIPRDNIPISNTAEPIAQILNNLKIEKEDFKLAYIIGPEGGFSPNEHKKASEFSLKFAKLNTNVLRSETASIAILSIIKAILG